MSDMLKAALWYAEHGFYVHPLRPKDKKPIIDQWGINATTAPEQVHAYWDNRPEANIGVATRPSLLVVIDVDVKDGAPGMENWRDLVAELGKEIEDTVITETPSGGLHLWYKANGTTIGNKELAPGIDVRAAGGDQGGYVVAPPSVTPVGEYHWAMGNGIHEHNIANLPEPLAAMLTEKNKQRAEPIEGPIGKGQRNETLASLAGSLRQRGMDQAVIETTLLQVNRERCTPPLPEQEVRKVAKSISRYEAGSTGEHCTDLGNARRFVARHAQDVRYCDPLGGWMVWDGKRWAPDDTSAVQRMAQDTVRSIYQEARNEPDPDRRGHLGEWAVKCEAAYRMRAMLELAQTQIEIVARPEEFDTNPWLLNVENGTLDLRTGELRPHQREDLITKLAPVEYDPEATDPVLTRYLKDTTDRQRAFERYLQQACGYTLTGLTDEESLFLVLGPAATGKSTLVEAMLHMLGDYGVKASFNTFLAQDRVSAGPRPDIARLRGARMAAAVESRTDRSLAENVVKELTGGDTVSVRNLYEAPFEFKPEFKLWLAANESPELSDDSAIWRRLKRLPFEHELAPNERDPEVKRHLCSPEGGRALLTWAVDGCLAWQENGLQTCDVVRAKTEALRADMNPIGEFVRMYCVVNSDAEALARDLRDAYEEWANDMGAKAITDRDWGRRLKALGCSRKRERRNGHRLTVWHGIGLVGDEPDPPVDTPDTPDMGSVGNHASTDTGSTLYTPRVQSVHPVQNEGETDLADGIGELFDGMGR